MTRAEAELLIGHRVVAWTAMNGEYTGTLVQVLPNRPWRGVVLIDGVLTPPAFEFGRSYRRGFRPGDRLEVGGANIKPTTAQGGAFVEALRAMIVTMERWAENPAYAHLRVPAAAIAPMREALAKEVTSCS
jgi:hypothetical protein